MRFVISHWRQGSLGSLRSWELFHAQFWMAWLAWMRQSVVEWYEVKDYNDYKFHEFLLIHTVSYLWPLWTMQCCAKVLAFAGGCYSIALRWKLRFPIEFWDSKVCLHQTFWPKAAKSVHWFFGGMFSCDPNEFTPTLYDPLVILTLGRARSWWICKCNRCDLQGWL